MVQAMMLPAVVSRSQPGILEHLPSNPAKTKLLNPNEWLARELHDGLLQNLVYLDLELTSLASESTTEAPDFDHRVQNLKQVVQVGIEELRDALGLLRSQNARGSDQAGGVRRPSLQEETAKLVEAFRARYGGRLKLEMPDLMRPITVPPFVSHQIQAIIHEAVSNALRHSDAMEVNVCFQTHCKGIVLTVADAGRGFDLAASPRGHYGLRIMKERADAIGASLRIVSALGKGTRVRLYVSHAALKAEGS